VVQGTLTAGQTSDTLIAGVALTLRAGTWDATSVAHITTIAPTLTLTGITTYANLATAASYTSPVFDSGVSNTGWPLLEMTEGPVGSLVPTITMGVGDTPIPDGTWTWQTVVPVTTPDVFGNPLVPRGMAGTVAARTVRTGDWRPEQSESRCPVRHPSVFLAAGDRPIPRHPGS